MSAVNRIEPPRSIIDPLTYATYGYPHREWARLRAEEPVAFCNFDGFPPFWALTKHRDIVEVSAAADTFLNGPRIAIFPDREQPAEHPLRHLLTMDDPDHRRYRELIVEHFSPRAMRRARPGYETLADAVLDRIEDREEVDFVTEIAAVLPIWIIAELLGIPEGDREQFFRWTNQLVAPNDPEFRAEGKGATATSDQSIAEQTAYFEDLAAERRRRPKQDLTSVLANAQLEGEPLPALELVSYLVLLVAAGNETTRNAASSGMLALMEHPRQWELLRRKPDELTSRAVEEMVRWATPVNQFCRTPNRDVEIRGKTIRAGEHLCLFYASANRDEDIFDSPNSFRVDRHPNPHLGFGHGGHVCLGADSAREQLAALFSRLLARLETIQPNGPTDRLRSSFIGGIKHLPVRVRLRS